MTAASIRPAASPMVRFSLAALAVLTVLFALTPLALAEEISLRFGFEPDGVELVESGAYTRLALRDGVLPEDKPGTPWLPVKYVKVVVPADAKIEGVAATGVEVALARGLIVLPVQPPVPLSEPAPAPTPMDAAAYASATATPAELAVLEDVQRLHGYALAIVRLNPVRYVAATGEVRLVTTLDLEVVYRRSNVPAANVGRSFASARAKAAAPSIESLVANPDDVGAFAPRENGPRAATDTSAVYLLITNDALTTAFQPLVDRRSGQGLTGKLMTVAQIEAAYTTGTDVQQNIRECIRDHYQNHGTVYVCLGGDDTVVADRDCYVRCGSYIESHMPTDLYYGGLDGTWNSDGDGTYGEAGEDLDVDLLPEVWVGRIPVRTAGQATAYVNKLIAYETASPTDFSGRVLLTGESLWNTYVGTRRPSDFREHEIVSDAEIWNNRLYQDCIQPHQHPTLYHELHDTRTSWDATRTGDYAQSPAHLSDQINNVGYHFVHMATHGNSTVWAMESGGSYRPTHAEALTNAGKPSIVGTIACITGAWDLAEPCLSEGFIRNPNGGAVAYMGCSRYGWGSPGSGTGGTSFLYSRTFFETVLRDGYTIMGEAFGRHKLALAPSSNWNSSTRWVQFGLNLQGDPAFAIHGAEPGRRLQVVEPNGLEIYEPATNVTIRWNAGGAGWQAGDLVQLEYSPDAGGGWLAIAGAEALPHDDGTFAWNNTDAGVGDDFLVRVSWTAGPGLNDESNGVFRIRPIGLLTVDSSPFQAVTITGTMRGDTPYTFTHPAGDAVRLVAPTRTDWTFLHWRDDAGTTYSTNRDYTFTLPGDATRVAEYIYSGGSQVYYVNDETPENGIAAGDDANDGLTPATPMRLVRTVFESYSIGFGDTIYISDCVVAESLSIYNANSGVALQGAGVGRTIWDGEDARRCLYFSGVTSATLRGMTFRNGWNNWSGGALCAYNTALDLADCEFTGNYAQSFGAALYASGCDLLARRCAFNDNLGGRGVGVYSAGAGVVRLEGCRFARNIGAEYGGAVNASGLGNRTTLVNCVIARNSAAGAAVRADTAAWLRSINCTFIGNENFGGDVAGLEFADGATSGAAVNTIFAENGPGAALGVTNCGATPPARIANNLFHENGVVFIIDGAARSLAELEAADYAAGNLAGDPVFVDEFAEPANCNLGCDSLALDRGTDADAPATDIEGAARPFDVPGEGADGTGTEFDIGAYESAELLPLPDIKVSASALTLDFGGREVDDGPTSPLTLIVSNVGCAPLSFTGAGVALSGVVDNEFQIVNTPDTSPLDPGDSCLVELVFDPASVGARSADLVITSADPDEATVTVALIGQGLLMTAPKMIPEPEFTKGWENTVQWTDVADATTYTVQRAVEPGFRMPAETQLVAAATTEATFLNLWGPETQWYRARAENALGVSAWSAPTSSTQDSGTPFSWMTAPTGTASSTTLYLEWIAQDGHGGVGNEASGLESIDVYWQFDGGAFLRFGTLPGETTGTAFLTSGPGVYGFYTQARDRAGNEEWPKRFAEVSAIVPPMMEGRPAMTAEPAWTAGAANMVSWSEVVRSTTYTVQCAEAPDFAAPVAMVELTSPSWNYLFGGLADDRTYWYRVRSMGELGETSAWSTPTFSTQDASGPVGAVTIEGGAEFVALTTVTLSLAFVDPGVTPSGLAEMRFSVDGVAWGAWEAYAASKAWALAPGDGVKAVYAQCVDGVGNLSLASSDTIMLDTCPPDSALAGPAGTCETLTFQIGLTHDDPGAWCSGVESVEVFWRKDGGTTQSLGVFAPSVANVAFNAGAHGGDGEYSFYSIARDAAGNVKAYGGFELTVTVAANTSPLTARRHWMLLE